MNKLEKQRADLERSRLPLAQQVVRDHGDFEMLGELFGTTADNAKAWLRYNPRRAYLFEAINANCSALAKLRAEKKAQRARKEAEYCEKVDRLAKVLNCSHSHAEKAIKRYSLVDAPRRVEVSS